MITDTKYHHKKFTAEAILIKRGTLLHQKGEHTGWKKFRGTFFNYSKDELTLVSDKQQPLSEKPKLNQ